MTGNSFSLSRSFALLGLVSIAAISATSGWLLSGFLTEHILQQEARLTHEVVDSIVRVENADRYFVNGQQGRAQEFREFLDHLLRLPDVLRVNLYSRKRTVIWSSDPALAGREFNHNPELDQALGGSVVAHGGKRAKPEHADFDKRFLPYFVEIYSPVLDEAGGVIGVVELYKTPQAMFAAVTAGQRAIWIGSALAGFFLYVSFFWMVRRADNLIRMQRERLVQSETLAVIGEMSSTVAHGIRNPLASIRSSAELALVSDPACWREAAGDIVDQVDRLEAWVRELLSYSQPLTGQTELIQLGALVHASLASFERELERRGIRASARVSEGLPPVTADALMLGQVFNSLIANAMEAIEREGRISIIVDREGERQLRVSIEDSGPGMAREQLENAFKLFHTTKPKGVGVGLPLAQRIVQRFGGSIRLANRPGGGMTVSVLLPAA